jgi:hypothetical protein
MANINTKQMFFDDLLQLLLKSSQTMNEVSAIRGRYDSIAGSIIFDDESDAAVNSYGVKGDELKTSVSQLDSLLSIYNSVKSAFHKITG